MRFTALSGILAVTSAFGQLSVSAPSLGLVADPVGGVVRPVLGVRGFPGLGAPLSLVEEGGRTLLSPRAGFAVVETPRGWKIVTIRGSETGTSRAMELPQGEVKLAALSPSGSAAVFYFEDSSRLFAMAGLPNEPRESFSSNIAVGPVLSIAINDAGDLALLGSGGDSGKIVAVRKGVPETVVSAGAPTAISFVAGKNRAVIADRDRNEVVSVEIAASGSAVHVLATEDAGIRAPVDLAVNESDNRVLVLSRGSRNILDLSLAGDAARMIDCPFEPARIAALQEHHLYSVSSVERGARWVLRLEADGPQLVYLPAVD